MLGELESIIGTISGCSAWCDARNPAVDPSMRVVVSSCSAHTHRSAMDRRVRVRAPTPSSTTTSATTSALATGCRASAGFSVPRCAWRMLRARQQAPAAGKGPPEGADGREPRRDGCRSRAWVGPDGGRPARRADRPRGAARRARPLSAALGVRLFNVRNGDARAPRYA